jgi:hypothetical protein
MKKSEICSGHRAILQDDVPNLDDESSAARIEELKRLGYEVKVIETEEGRVVLKRKRLDVQ